MTSNGKKYVIFSLSILVLVLVPISYQAYQRLQPQEEVIEETVVFISTNQAVYEQQHDGSMKLIQEAFTPFYDVFNYAIADEFNSRSFNIENELGGTSYIQLYMVIVDDDELALHFGLSETDLYLLNETGVVFWSYDTFNSDRINYLFNYKTIWYTTQRGIYSTGFFTFNVVIDNLLEYANEGLS